MEEDNDRIRPITYNSFLDNESFRIDFIPMNQNRSSNSNVTTAAAIATTNDDVDGNNKPKSRKRKRKDKGTYLIQEEEGDNSPSSNNLSEAFSRLKTLQNLQWEQVDLKNASQVLYLEKNGILPPATTEDDDTQDYSSCDEEEINDVVAKDKQQQQQQQQREEDDSSVLSIEEEEEEEESSTSDPPWTRESSKKASQTLDAVMKQKKQTPIPRSYYTKSLCVGCMWGSSAGQPVASKRLQTILNVFGDNYGKMTEMALARTIHLYYKNVIYLPAKKIGKPLPIWRTRSIRDHFKNHTMDPRIFIGEHIQKLKKMNHLLFDTMFRRFARPDGGGTILIADPNHSKLFLQNIKTMVELYKIDPQSLSFFDESCVVDFKRTASLINTNHPQKLQYN